MIKMKKKKPICTCLYVKETINIARTSSPTKKKKERKKKKKKEIKILMKKNERMVSTEVVETVNKGGCSLPMPNCPSFWFILG